MHVNAIINETSSDRTFIIKTINVLVKNGVVEKIRNPDHKEMRMIQPTSVGEEIIWFFSALERYNESYSALIKKVDANFVNVRTLPKYSLSRPLKSKSWRNSEIISHDALHSKFAFTCAFTFMYLKLIPKYNHKIFITNLLTEILTNALHEHMVTNLPRLHDTFQLSSTQYIEEVEEGLRPLSEAVRQYIFQKSDAGTNFAEKEVKELKASIWQMITPMTNSFEST
jgi:hypothetical protein